MRSTMMKAEQNLREEAIVVAAAVAGTADDA